MSMLLPKHFPNVLLRIQLRAITRQAMQFHLLPWVFHKVFDRFTFVVRGTVNDQDQVAVGRITKRYQKGPESLLRKVAQLDTVAEQPRAGDGAKSLDSLVTTEGLMLRRVPDARPSASNRALRGQRHFVFKENGRSFQTRAPRNLWLGFTLPAILRRRISQGQQALW